MIRIDEPSNDTRVLSLAASEPIRFIGGGGIDLHSPRDPDHLKRPFAILSSDEEQMRITVAIQRIADGAFCESLFGVLTEGAEVLCGAPYETDFTVRDDDPIGPVLVVSTDTGITASIGLVNGARFAPFRSEAVFVHFRSQQNPFLSDSFIADHLPEPLQSSFVTVEIPSADQYGRYGAIRSSLSQRLFEKRPLLAFVSGDGYSIRVIRELLQVHGLEPNKIRIEPFFNSDMKKTIPKDPSDLRTGYTTGACAAAAAAAATRALIRDEAVDRIKSLLPNRSTVLFPVKRCERSGREAICSIVKDAGDDPDCTHLAEISATVRLTETAGIVIRGGEGVATVTLPGLGLAVGAPSITSVPTKNITEMVERELNGVSSGIEVTISVTDGERIAQKTTNHRLGLIGGISILGTTGLVVPYSTAAFRRSILQAIDVAVTRGATALVFTTGGRTEQLAMKQLSALPEESFVQVGDFIGVAVRHAKQTGIKKVFIYGMIGKLSKMADGVVQTHEKGSSVNFQLLETIAGEIGLSAERRREIASATTARRVMELCDEEGVLGKLAQAICGRVVRVMGNYARGRKKGELTVEPENEESDDFSLECCMVDFQENVIGRDPER